MFRSKRVVVPVTVALLVLTSRGSPGRALADPPDPPRPARTIVVDPGGGADFERVAEALEEARDRDVVELAPGEHLLDATLELGNHAITLRGVSGDSGAVRLRLPASRSGAEHPLIRVSPPGEGFSPQGDLVVSDLTLDGSRGEMVSVGDGLPAPFEGRTGLVEGSERQKESRFRNLEIVNYHDGLVFEGSVALARDLTLEDGTGTGIRVTGPGSPTISRARIEGHRRGPGILVEDHGSLALGESQIIDCGDRRDADFAVAIEARDRGFLDFSKVEIRNSAGTGIRLDATSSGVIESCIVEGSPGAGIESAGDLELRACVLRRHEDGALHASGRVSLRDCLILENRGRPGAGVLSLEAGARAWMTRMTLVQSSVGGDGASLVVLDPDVIFEFDRSIIWNGGGPSLGFPEGVELADVGRITRSTLQGPSVPAGEGNSNEDPLLIGHGGPREIFVDALEGSDDGDGSEERPLRTLEKVVPFNWLPGTDSPFRGAGQLEADRGVSIPILDDFPLPIPPEGPGQPAVEYARETDKVIHLSAGLHRLESRLPWNLSLRGEGIEMTEIVGRVEDLGGDLGTRIENLTVRADSRGPAVSVRRRASGGIHEVRVLHGSEGVLGKVGAHVDIQKAEILESAGHGIRLESCTGLSLLDSSVRDHPGTGIHLSARGMRVENSRIESCRGGGVFAELEGRRLDRCSVSPGDSMDNAGQVGIFNSIIRGNGAFGVFLGFPEQLVAFNSIIDGNAGPGLRVDQGLQFELSHLVVAGNDRAVDIRSMITDGGLLSFLTNSILAGNRQPTPLVLQSFFFREVERCILEELHPGAEEFGNFVADPRFVREGRFDFERFRTIALPDGRIFEVPAFTIVEPDYHLRSGSPAIGAGGLHGVGLTRDLAGVDRLCDDELDIGVYEFAPCPVEPPGPPRFVRGDGDFSGTIDIADALIGLSYLFLGATAIPCQDALDLDDDGQITMADPIYLLVFRHLGGPRPAPPYPRCGEDPGLDLLSCLSPEPCPPS